jgi:putative oxidoreductase
LVRVAEHNVEEKAMEIATIVLQILLGLAFLAAGGSKLAGAQSQKGEFKRFGYPLWFMYLTGILESIGALGMIVGVFSPVWKVPAGLLLAAVMVGAILTHVRVKDPDKKLMPATVLFLLALAVIAIYFLG